MSLLPVESGFYGKIPARGDFVRHGLPHAFVQAWDEWLSAGLAEGRRHFGAQWEGAFMTAPLWRFHLAPGLCAPQPVAGVLCPSVDRVGRAFPLLLCALGAPLGPGLSAAGAAWYGALEALALEVLESRLEPDRIAARLAGMDYPAWGAGGASRYDLPAIDSPLASLPADAALAQADALAGVGLWWSDGSDRVAPSLRMCRFMPDAAGLAAMFAGEGP